MDTIQKRKNPLTTIAISQECAKKLDEYLLGSGLNRKEFVELSIDYFKRTGFDIRSSVFDLTPLEKMADRLEASARVMEENNKGTEAIKQLLQFIQEQTVQKQLPAPEILVRATEERISAQHRASDLEEENRELRQWKEKALEEFQRIATQQRTIGKIKINPDIFDS